MFVLKVTFKLRSGRWSLLCEGIEVSQILEIVLSR